MIITAFIAVCACAYWMIFIKPEGVDPVGERRKDTKQKRELKRHERVEAWKDGFDYAMGLVEEEKRREGLKKALEDKKGAVIQP